MKIYFYYINGIAGLEDWLDRDLLFEVSKALEVVSFSDGGPGYVDPGYHMLNLTATDLEDLEPLRRLELRKTYAVEYEGNDEKTFKYYSLVSYEIERDSETTFRMHLLVLPLTPSI